VSSFTSELIVSPLADGRRWILLRQFSYHVGSEYSKDVISVPRGFATDFASVPRIFWPLICPYGKQGKAAVIHDYLYQSGERPRKEADDIFREAMGVLGVSSWKKFLMYWAVRIFGKFAYKKYIDDSDLPEYDRFSSWAERRKL